MARRPLALETPEDRERFWQADRPRGADADDQDVHAASDLANYGDGRPEVKRDFLNRTPTSPTAIQKQCLHIVAAGLWVQVCDQSAPDQADLRLVVKFMMKSGVAGQRWANLILSGKYGQPTTDALVWLVCHPDMAGGDRQEEYRGQAWAMLDAGKGHRQVTSEDLLMIQGAVPKDSPIWDAANNRRVLMESTRDAPPHPTIS